MLTLKGRIEEVKEGLGYQTTTFIHINLECPEYPHLETRYRISMGRRSALSLSLAERLLRAIDAGVAYPNARVAVDINGVEYITFDINICGKDLVATLTEMGF